MGAGGPDPGSSRSLPGGTLPFRKYAREYDRLVGSSRRGRARARAAQRRHRRAVHRDWRQGNASYCSRTQRRLAGEVAARRRFMRSPYRRTGRPATTERYCGRILSYADQSRSMSGALRRSGKRRISFVTFAGRRERELLSRAEQYVRPLLICRQRTPSAEIVMTSRRRDAASRAIYPAASNGDGASFAARLSVSCAASCGVSGPSTPQSSRST